MNFSEQLRNLRKQSKLSQEELAEKLHVSRQAVTKWETDTGVPDWENMRAISSLFQVSIDELISNPAICEKINGLLYESVTEYDIDAIKNFDIKFCGAKATLVTGYSGEKIRVRLQSDTLPDIQRMFKVKIDDNKNQIDIEVNRFAQTADSTAKEALYIRIELPQDYIRKIELSGNTNRLEICAINADNIEFQGKTNTFYINDSVTHVELDCSMDMNIMLGTFRGKIDVNQISSSSKLLLLNRQTIRAAAKGRTNAIYFMQSGKMTEDFTSDSAEIEIELNGMKNELIIERNN